MVMPEVFVDPDVLRWLADCTSNTAHDTRDRLGRCQDAVSHVDWSGWDSGRWSGTRDSISGQLTALEGLERDLRTRSDRASQLAGEPPQLPNVPLVGALEAWLGSALKTFDNLVTAVEGLLGLHKDARNPLAGLGPLGAKAAPAGLFSNLPAAPIANSSATLAGKAAKATPSKIPPSSVSPISVAALDVVSSYASLPVLGYRKNDCVDYALAVMTKIGVATRPGLNGDIYTSAGWTGTDHSSFSYVAPSSEPPPGSFFVMGQDGDAGNHHAGIYLGSRDGYVFVAQSNWGKGDWTDPPSVFKYRIVGNRLESAAVDVASLKSGTWNSAGTARQTLLQVWADGAPKGTAPADININFYVPKPGTGTGR
jgi:hypothetical protein